MGTMHIVVADVARIVDEVPTMNIAFETIVIVVEAGFAFSLSSVRPEIILQVGMRQVDTCINNSYHRTFGIDDILVP